MLLSWKVMPVSTSSMIRLRPPLQEFHWLQIVLHFATWPNMGSISNKGAATFIKWTSSESNVHLRMSNQIWTEV